MFFVFLYVISGRYFQYKTITDVRPIIHSKDLPNITTSVCAGWQSHRTHYIDFDIDLTINGVYVNSTSPYIADRAICRDIYLEQNPILVDQILFARYRGGFNKNIGIMKRLEGSYVDESNYIYRFSTERTVFNVLMYPISLLPSPYDTNCMNYNMSQIFCYNSCGISSQRFEECSKHCTKPACHSLVFYGTFVIANNNDTVIFNKNIITTNSTPELTYTVLIQQFVGLIILFFNFAIIDIRKPIMNMLAYIKRSIKS